MPRSGPLPAALSLLLVTAALLPGPAAAQNGEGGGGGGGALLWGRLVAKAGDEGQVRGLRGHPPSPEVGGLSRVLRGRTCVFGSLGEGGGGWQGRAAAVPPPPRLLLRRLVLPVKWNISSRLLNLHLPGLP